LEQETMEHIQPEVDLEFPEENFVLPKENCRHCGGIMRYYRGSVTCMMCGRDGSHQCLNCARKEMVFHPVAPAANGAAA
jgi:predicted amidophosphoribosyltransferase